LVIYHCCITPAPPVAQQWCNSGGCSTGGTGKICAYTNDTTGSSNHNRQTLPFALTACIVLYSIRRNRAREWDSMTKAPVTQQSGNLATADILADCRSRFDSTNWNALATVLPPHWAGLSHLNKSASRVGSEPFDRLRINSVESRIETKRLSLHRSLWESPVLC
jgi:hypothetical protein